MKSYAVIGLGRFGSALSRQLCKLGAEVLALDVRADFVQQISGDVTHAVVGDAQDKEVLKALGVRNLDCAVIAIGDNLAASVLIAMNLKELGVPYVVCKAHDETHRKVLEKLGVDRVLIPEVVRFDEDAVVLQTDMGTLTVQGEQLQLKELSVEGGRVTVEGTISALSYEAPRQSGSFLQRLLG